MDQTRINEMREIAEGLRRHYQDQAHAAAETDKSLRASVGDFARGSPKQLAHILYALKLEGEASAYQRMADLMLVALTCIDGGYCPASLYPGDIVEAKASMDAVRSTIKQGAT